MYRIHPGLRDHVQIAKVREHCHTTASIHTITDTNLLFTTLSGKKTCPDFALYLNIPIYISSYLYFRLFPVIACA